MTKVILRKAQEADSEWEQVTLEYAIERLSGYWTTDKIESMLLDEGLTLWTPFANYKAVYKES